MWVTERSIVERSLMSVSGERGRMSCVAVRNVDATSELALDQVEMWSGGESPGTRTRRERIGKSPRDIMRGERETLEELDAVGLRSAGRDDDS